MTQKYFSDAESVGRTLSLNGNQDYRVSVIVSDLPDNTHLAFDFLILFEANRYTDRRYINESWYSAPRYSYLKLKAPKSAGLLRIDLINFITRNVPMEIQCFEGIAISNFMQFDLIALADIHLYLRKVADITPPGNILTVTTFSIVAVFILLIGIVNYFNLATERAMLRAREFGLGKVLGACRRELIAQFLGESLLTAAAALLLAMAFVETVSPLFNNFLAVSLEAMQLTDPAMILTTAGLIIFVALAGGLYPAFFLSSFRPSRVLRGRTVTMAGSSLLRNTLVVLQIAIAIGLIAATATI